MSQIRKTRAMLDVEAAKGGRLEDLIPEALRTTPRDLEAASSLGILPTTLSHWIGKLQIHEQCEAARELRAEKVA